jgi:hypothetical protein
MRTPLRPRKNAAPTRAEERIGLLACPTPCPIGELLGVLPNEFDPCPIAFADDPNAPDTVVFDDEPYRSKFGYGSTADAMEYLHTIPVKPNPLFSEQVENAWKNHDLDEAKETARQRARWKRTA